MKSRRKSRGISLGTVFMLALTILVLGGTLTVLPRLGADTVIHIDADRMLQTLSLSDGLPELSLSDIPISVHTAQPTAVPESDIRQTMAPATSVPTPQATAAPTPTPYAGGTVSFTIGGSVNMDEAVRKSGYYSESEKYDFSELFSLIRDEWNGDITLLSLENLVMPAKKVSALNAPEAIMPALSELGIDLVALGFPKAFDQKMDGVTSTLTAAATHQLQTVGVYPSSDETAGYITDVNGVKVGCLHYTQSLSSTGAKAIKKADVAYAVPVASAEHVAADIAAMRAQGVHIVLVSMNWDGSKTTPTKSQITLAQQIADAGADIIVGTGTGIVQPAVWLEGLRSDGTKHQTLCAYSLGSLISESRTNGGVASMLLQLKISVDGNGKVGFDQVSYTPTYIWRYKQDGKYFYRVVASDQPSPDGMGEEQTEVKDRAFANLKKYMGEDSVLTLRTK